MTTKTQLAALILSDPAQAKREAARIVSRPSLPRPRRIPKAGPTRAQEKRGSRAERNARMAEIRREVMEHAEGRCELCAGLAAYVGGTFPADAVHHVLSGVGQRRQHESAATCVAVCRYHHGQLHKNDPEAQLLLLRWADRHGYTLALGAALRRQAKVLESRESEGRAR